MKKLQTAMLFLFLFGTLSAQALSSITVDDVDVGRDGLIRPTLTLTFDDNSTTTTTASQSHLVSLQPTGFVEYEDRGFLGSGLARQNNVADTTVSASWSVTIGGVTKTATSNVFVKGQLSEVVVPNISLGRGEVKLPFLTLKYTDDTEDIENPIARNTFGDLIYFDSFQQPNIVQIVEPAFSPSGFQRRSNVPDTLVTVNWSHTDGVQITSTSTIDVTGELASIQVDAIDLDRTSVIEPPITFTYTDNSQETLSSSLQVGQFGGRAFFVSFDEPNIVNISEPSFGPRGFVRRSNVPDTLVIGVTQQLEK